MVQLSAVSVTDRISNYNADIYQSVFSAIPPREDYRQEDGPVKMKGRVRNRNIDVT